MDYAIAYRFGTKLTRDILDGAKNPSRNMHNRKPYRTKAQKAEARHEAVRCKDGAWRSPVAVSVHSVPRQQNT